MKIAVINCSLKADSRASILAELAVEQLKQGNHRPRYLDLRTLELPIADATSARREPDLRKVESTVEQADAVLLAIPIYNFSVNATVLNLITVTGQAWDHKIVGFMCTGGSRTHYMAVMNLVATMMLEYHCVVVPRFVFATTEDFSRGELHSSDIEARVDELCKDTARMAKALLSDHGPGASTQSADGRTRKRVRIRQRLWGGA